MPRDGAEDRWSATGHEEILGSDGNVCHADGGSSFMGTPSSRCKKEKGGKKEITMSTNELNQTLRETITPVLFKTSQSTEQKGTLPNSFYDTRITLIPEPGKNSTSMKSMMLCTYVWSYH